MGLLNVPPVLFAILVCIGQLTFVVAYTDSFHFYCTRGGLEETKDVNSGDSGNITSVGYPRGYSILSPRGDTCHILLQACPTCKIRFRLAEIRFPPCSADLKNPVITDWDSPCVQGCDYLILEDATRPFSDQNKKYFTFQDQGAVFTSLSREVRLTHCMSNNMSPQGKSFRIYFQVDEKWSISRGSPRLKGRTEGVLMSPNFPHGYSMVGDVYTYYLENSFLTGAIRLIFDDWDIAPQSKILVYDGIVMNDTVTVLERFDRPVYTSTTNKVYIKFHTGTNLYSCCKNIGFKATYHFVSKADWPDRPSTDCSSTRAMDGGGVIRFRGASVAIPKHYDCLWIFKRYDENDADGALLQLRKVYPGTGMVEHKNARLEIRSGISSVASPLAIYTNDNITQEVSWFTSGSGYYIRLTGTFLSTDKVFFVFTSVYNASNGACPDGHFLCHNDFCIHEELVCDKVDHCGDHSDESPAQDCTSSTVLSDPTPCNGFECHDGTACINAKNQCDAIPDCYDDSDEKDCHLSGCQSVPSLWILYIVFPILIS